MLIPFPFSDLSNSKLRPVVVIAEAGRGDWVMCLITSKPYADNSAIEIKDEDFIAGALRLTSYARPGKLFTANESLIASEIGILKNDAIDRIITAVIKLIQSGSRK